jgi:hypothetical protein
VRFVARVLVCLPDELGARHFTVAVPRSGASKRPTTPLTIKAHTANTAASMFECAAIIVIISNLPVGDCYSAALEQLSEVPQMCHVNPSPSHWPSLAQQMLDRAVNTNTTSCYPPSTHQSSGSEWINGWVVGKKSIDDGAQM